VDETTIDLKELLRILKKQRKTILTVFLVIVISATLVTLLTSPTYEGETTLRIKQQKGLGSSLLADLPMGNSMMTKQTMSTYAEILKSRSVVRMVLEKTRLRRNNKPVKYEDFIKQITTEPVKDTELLKVAVQGRTPLESQMLTNLLVDSFIERMTVLVRVEQKTVREFIGERLRDAKIELDESEETLKKYKQNEKIVAPEEETKAMVEQLSSITKLEAENTVALASAEARLRSAEQHLAGQKPSYIADSPLIQQYRTKLSELEVELVSLLQRYTEQHPQVLTVRAAVEETKDKLSTEIARVINSEAVSANPVHQRLLQEKLQAEAEIAAANSQKEALARIFNHGESQLIQLPAKEQGLGRLMRNTMLAQEIFVMLAKRYEEARISEVMQPTDIQVIDVAVAPEKPIKPKKTLNVLIAMFLGLFAGTGLAFMLEYLNKTIQDADDVKYYLDLPVLGTIPDFTSVDRKSRKK
jgi:succinoglycan biosynthesis transport protein ExoP